MKVLCWFFTAINYVFLLNHTGFADLVLSTVNIDTGNTSSRVFAGKLYISVGPHEKGLLVNTGSSLQYFGSGPKTVCEIWGSTLGKSKYRFIKTRINFDELHYGNTGVTVDGIGAPVSMDIFFYNTKYPSWRIAFEKPDGLAIVRLFTQVAIHSNPNFQEFQYALEKVKKPGTSVVTPYADIYPWFNVLPLTTHYYQYRGLFSYGNGLTNYATVFLIPPTSSTSISGDQFCAFSGLESFNGHPLTDDLKYFRQEKVCVTEVLGKAALIPLHLVERWSNDY